ncbi:MAG TPA: TaqI-like C-terminal specificity domain-containing protein, partial [Paludibacter sp.]
KINGYKDGSFFTPGFITMYMCRETIRRAVVQKFNETKGWNCKEFGELYENIDSGAKARTEANAIINSLKICDPAVGSGHFLVSALNEIIAIKSELRILSDRDSKRLKEYSVVVENDELIVTDEDGNLIEYNPTSHESQRVQETLFHEKQTIIENCLFGVDLNPNSVKICRLRLWIELLKNAYYKNNTELETLPNIDINIKCGNSLISRFALDSDLKQALKNSKFSIVSYRSAVDLYRNAENKEQKWEMEKLIATIKLDFKSNIDNPFKKTISTARAKVDNLATQINTKKQWGEKVDKKAIAEFEKAVAKLKKLEDERDDIEANKIYENAFEWRFEFPEVLNDEGDFVGFDVVIGNPPYIPSKELSKSDISFFNNEYLTAEYQINTYSLFCELGLRILQINSFLNYIIPNYWLSTKNDQNLRQILFIDNNTLELLNVYSVFDSATVDTLLLTTKKNRANIIETAIRGIDPKCKSITERLDLIKDRRWIYNKKMLLTTENMNLIGFKDQINIKGDVNLSELMNSKFGIKVYQIGKGIPKQSKEMIETDIYQAFEKKDQSYYKMLRARDIGRYFIKQPKLYIKYGKHLAEPRNLTMFKGSRILVQRIVGKKYLNCAYVEDEFLCNSDVISFFPKNKMSETEVKAITSIMNSRLCLQYLKITNINLERDAYPKINTNSLNDFPIRLSDDIFQKLSNLVDELLALKSLDQDTTILESEIDQLVYKLYGLTKEEIKIVEGK